MTKHINSWSLRPTILLHDESLQKPSGGVHGWYTVRTSDSTSLFTTRSICLQNRSTLNIQIQSVLCKDHTYRKERGSEHIVQ